MTPRPAHGLVGNPRTHGQPASLPHCQTHFGPGGHLLQLTPGLGGGHGHPDARRQPRNERGGGQVSRLVDVPATAPPFEATITGQTCEIPHVRL
jgi:hypothetical protein